MADFSLALNPNAPKPVDYGAAYGKGLQLQNLALQPQITQEALLSSQQARQNAQAQEEAMRADNVAKQQAARATQWIADESAKHVKDGKLNQLSFVQAAADAGFLTQAIAVASNDIVNSKAIQDLKRGEIVNANDKQNLYTKFEHHITNLVSNLPPAQQKAEWTRLVDGAEKQFPGAASHFGEYTPEKVQALRLGTITPLAQEELKLRQEEQKKTFSDSLYSPDGKDPNSSASQQAQRLYIDANPSADPAQIRKMSAYDITLLPGGKESITKAFDNTQITVSDRITLSKDKQAAKASLSVVDEGLTAADALAKRLGGDFPNIASNSLTSIWGKLTENERMVMQRAIDELNRLNKTNLDRDTVNFGSIRGVLAGAQRVLEDDIKRHQAIEGQGGQAPAKGAITAPKEAPKAAAPATTEKAGKVRVRSPDGTTGWIPKAQVKEALSEGYTLI